MKQLFFVFFLLSSSILLADWPVTEDAGPYEYRDNMSNDLRDPMDIGFCDCPCDSVIKSVKVYEDQEDDEVYLSAGYHIGQMRCQKIEIVVNACYQQTLSSIDFKFDVGDSTDYCFEGRFYVYRSLDSDPDTATSCSDFDSYDPLDNKGQFCLIPPVDACSSATFTFYICSDYIDFCEHDDIPATLSVGNCNINMMFYFDFYTGTFQLKTINPINSVIHHANPSKYRLINIYGEIINEGQVPSIDGLKNVLAMKNISAGLYIVQVYNGNSILLQDKIFIDNLSY
jgi:hypothetical protein